MALSKCKECKKEVSTKAPTCPHCGIKNPTTTAGQVVVGLLVVLAIGYGVVHFASSDDKKSDSAAAAKAAQDEAACKKDLSCWGEKNLAAASVYCKPEIEKLAKYSVKWTDGALEMKMSRYRWAKKEAETVTYLGDKAQFQNGFGAYQNVVYECDFDPASKSVQDVRIREGHI